MALRWGPARNGGPFMGGVTGLIETEPALGFSEVRD